MSHDNRNWRPLSSKPKPHQPRPDSLILIADTMGSSDYDSTDELRKVWLDDDLGIYAVGAGTLEFGGELFAIIQNEIRAMDAEQLPSGQHNRTHGRVYSVLSKSFLTLKNQHFQWDIGWSKLALPIMGVGSKEERDAVQAEWQKFCIDIQMIVGAFDHTGQAYLYDIGQVLDDEGKIADKIVRLREFPGFCTIGSGGYNADFWLKFRSQNLGMSVRQSAYHAYEAKRMAAMAPTVNDSIEIAIVQQGSNAFHLTLERQEINGCPISLPELEALYTKLGAHSTSDLGYPKPKPLAVRKSAGRK